MKIYFNYSLIILVLLAYYRSIAKDTDDWGPVTNNIQMSIHAEISTDKITINEPVKILIRYRNESTNETFGMYVVNGTVYDPNYSLSVISPSGKDISPDLKKYTPISGKIIVINPKQVVEIQFNLSSVCNLSEVGTYKIILKREMFTPQKHTAYTVVSNPLYVTIVAGQRKAEGSSTNNVQISISIKGEVKEIKTNQPFVLLIRIKNVSTNETFSTTYMDLVQADFCLSLVVISPPGKDISPKFDETYTGGSTSLHTSVLPGRTREFEYHFSNSYKLNEVGTYKIIATKAMQSRANQKWFNVVSNPLYISVVPNK